MKEYSVGSRILALLLCAVLILSNSPLNLLVRADELKGEVTVLTDGGTVSTGEDGGEIISYADATLQWSAKDPAAGRNYDGWWTGAKVMAPEGVSTETLEQATYRAIKEGDDWANATERSFWTDQDSTEADTQKFITLWHLIDEERAKAANQAEEKIAYIWQFDWNGDTIYDQTIHVEMDPAKVTLKKGDVKVYPAASVGYGMPSMETGRALLEEANEYDSSEITIKPQMQTYVWEVADPDAGKDRDGWWAGVKITAPDGMTAEQAKKAAFQCYDREEEEWLDYTPFVDTENTENNEVKNYVILWNELSGVQKEEETDTQWRFDWNGDGIADQLFVLDMDPNAIILQRDGVQLYPELGAVTTYTGGTVTGSKTSKTVVKITEAALEWDPADTSIGRNVDAWWVGIQVIAPANMSEAQLKDAVYQRKDVDTWSANKSFWNNKDSSAAPHYIQMWFPLTPDILASAIANNKDISRFYQFDWDGDENFDQNIEFTVVPSDKIVLNKKNQATLAFAVEAPADVWVGDSSYINVATGGTTDSAITYAVTEGSDCASINESTGELTITKAGTIKVTATKAGNDFYKDATAAYTLTAYAKDQTDFKFATTGTAESPITITYEENKTYQNQASGGEVADGAVTYSIVSQTYNGADADVVTLATDGTLTINQSGTVTVKAEKAGNNQYKKTEATYVLQINKAEQPNLAFASHDTTITWQSNAWNAPQVNGKLTGENLVYSITAGNEVATVDSASGAVTLLKSGDFTLTVTAPADACYLEKSVSTSIHVNKAVQTGFGFTGDKALSITYNDNDNKLEKPVAGSLSSNSVLYQTSDTSDDPVASVDQSGKVTILKAGTVTITATSPEDDCYETKSDSYTITVAKANQSIDFTGGDGLTVNKTYGLKEYTHAVSLSEKHGTGDMTYEVTGDAIGATVDNDGKITLADSETKVGTITVTSKKAADKCYNECQSSYTLTLSYLNAPNPAYTLSGDTKNTSGWYTGNVTITAPSGYTISKTNALSTSDWSNTIVISDEGETSPEIYLKDANGGISDKVTITGLKIDKTAPSDLAITYPVNIWKTVIEKVVGVSPAMSFANETVTAELTATDAAPGSGIAKVEYSTDGTNYQEVTKTAGKYAFDIAPQFRGYVSMKVTDTAGNMTSLNDGTERIVDSVSPAVTVSYTGDLVSKVEKDTDAGILRTDKETEDAVTRYIYKDTVTAKIEIEETNFYSEDITVTVKRDGAAVTDCVSSNWTKVNDKWTKTIQMAADGDYVLELTYADRSKNNMSWSAEASRTDTAETYVSNIHTVDKTAPVASFVIKDAQGNPVNEKDKFFKADQTAYITITDRNFRPNEVALTVTTEKNSETYTAPTLTGWAAWTSTDNLAWTAEVPFNVDAAFAVKLNYKDLADNSITQLETNFTVDKTAPTVYDVVYVEETGILDLIWNSITFVPNSPSKPATKTVTMTAKDDTAGVASFAVSATTDGSAGATTLTMPENLVVTILPNDVAGISGSAGFISNVSCARDTEDANKISISFTIPAQFRGNLSYTATDKSGNVSSAGNTTTTLVLDSINPERSTDYTIYQPDRVVKTADRMDAATYTEGDDVVLYYKDDAVVTFVISEANFYGEDVVFSVKKDGEEYTDFTISAWTQLMQNDEPVADSYKCELTLAEEGDYTIDMQYQDKSENTMTDYHSPKIIVDKTAPVCTVTFDQTSPKNLIDGRAYFTGKQKATIQIQEHNFRPEDVRILVHAKDYLGTEVLALNANGVVEAYAQQGADAAKWTAFEAGTWRRADDKYVLELEFTQDANYTLDVAYEDLARNAMTAPTTAQFTVDNTTPVQLAVSYSASVLDQVIGAISFGFYNAPVTVTISAADATSGIHHFEYSYAKASGVSAVNAELLNQAINAGSFTRNGNTATATFTVPSGALSATNQFNGNVSFSAFDRSENGTTLSESRRLVVDNISPVCTVAYDVPDQTLDGTSYYKTDIHGTITITEANFDAADVRVGVTLNGAEHPVNVNWTNNSVDVHVGTFTLINEGNYIVSINYTDKSGNAMAAYTSQTLTLDKTVPTIHVSNVKNQSANKDEVYAFSITARDINVDERTFQPELTAIVRSADGKYTTEKVELGNMITVVGGEEYRIDIQNLPKDALYTLTCRVLDLATNETNLIELDDEKTYTTVQFSINRDGSVFIYGSDYTKNVMERYYVYEVSQDLEIVEINVDPIENYEVMLNGRTLTEGTDYTTVQTSQEGEWSKRTYVLKTALFEQEGEYNIIVKSTDKAMTEAYSDVKNLVMSFVVDKTKPVVTIAGLEAGGRYQTQLQTVTLIPTDEGGLLQGMRIVILDSNGSPIRNEAGEDISVRFDMSGVEFLEYLNDNNGVITFTIPEALNCKVRIVCTDCSTDDRGNVNTYDELFERVTVSENRLIIFYANRPLFIGVIVGSVGGISLLAVLLRRKQVRREMK